MLSRGVVRAFVLGLREVGSGDAQAQLVLLKEVVGDISDALSKSNFSDTFFVSIKHLMSDRCYTQKMIIEIQYYLKGNLTGNLFANLEKVNI